MSWLHSKCAHLECRLGTYSKVSCLHVRADELHVSVGTNVPVPMRVSVRLPVEGGKDGEARADGKVRIL